MIAAIYARKSTEQEVATEAKSVARQEAMARKFKGSGQNRICLPDSVDPRGPKGK